MMIALAFIGCTHTGDRSSAMEKQNEIVVKITHDGRMFVAGEACRPSQMTDKLTQLSAKHPTFVLIYADSGAPYADVKSVIDSCQVAGVQSVAMATTK